MTISERIAALRTQKGMSEEDLASMLGMTLPELRNLEGELEAVRKLGSALQVNPLDLIPS